MQSYKVLITCQQTPTVGAMLKLMSAVAGVERLEVAASNPRFNQGLPDFSIPIKRVDCPVFGAAIPAAAARLVASLGGEFANLYPYSFDGFVQGKIDDVSLIADACDRIGADQAAPRLRAFVAAVRELDPRSIQSSADWEAFLCKLGIPDDWIFRLHFDHVTQLFGVTDEQLALLRGFRVGRREVGGVKTNTLLAPGEAWDGDDFRTLQDQSFGWLSKTLNLWRLSGCLTDVVNTAIALRGLEMKDGEKPSEQQLVAELDALRAGLLGGDAAAVRWTPDAHVHDNERDDVGSSGVIARARVVCRLPICVTCVQLPPDGTEVDDKKLGKRKINFGAMEASCTERGWVVFRDPASRNASALAAYM